MAETLGMVALVWLAVLTLAPLVSATVERPSEMLPKVGIEFLKLAALIGILFAVHLMDERGWIP